MQISEVKHGFPELYSKCDDCKWEIIVGSGYFIRLTFQEFEVIKRILNMGDIVWYTRVFPVG